MLIASSEFGTRIMVGSSLGDAKDGAMDASAFVEKSNEGEEVFRGDVCYDWCMSVLKIGGAGVRRLIRCCVLCRRVIISPSKTCNW